MTRLAQIALATFLGGAIVGAGATALVLRDQTAPQPQVTSQPQQDDRKDDDRVPDGWTLKDYRVEEVTNVSCNRHDECETPGEYLIRSSCPYTSMCLENKCTVVCPQMDDSDGRGGNGGDREPAVDDRDGGDGRDDRGDNR